MTYKKEYHNVESNPNLEITSWGGEWVYMQDLADDQGIMFLLHEIDDVIAALKEAKEVQQRGQMERAEREKMRVWNLNAARTYRPQ